MILESANLDELRKGRPAHTPDGTVLIAWTPDPGWLAEQLQRSGGDAAEIGRLIGEASRRPEAPLRPSFAPHEHQFRKDGK